MKKHIIISGLSAATLAVSSSAMAALPEAADAAVTEIQSTISDVIDMAWPLMLAVLGGTVALRLFSKFAKMGTR